MPIAIIKPKIIGVVTVGRIQFFLQGTYTAVMGERQAHLSLQSLHKSRPCCSAASLLLQIIPQTRLIPPNAPSCPLRKMVPCEYQSKPVAKFRIAEPAIRESFYRSIPHCLAIP